MPVRAPSRSGSASSTRNTYGSALSVPLSASVISVLPARSVATNW